VRPLTRKVSEGILKLSLIGPAEREGRAPQVN
jgi:hypothetical protein